MDPVHILVEQHERVGVITFNRPQEMNTLYPPMFEEVRQQIERWNADPGVGAIVLTGAGRAFCAGAHVGDWQRHLDQQPARPAVSIRPLPEWWNIVVMESKPIVCAINGSAIGGGLTITLPADARIASEEARLSMRFVRMGIVPELASSYLLPRIVGLGHATELILTGRIIDAQEAARIGLVNRVVPHAQLLDVAVRVAGEIANNDAAAVRHGKALIWKHLDGDDIAAIVADEWKVLTSLMDGPGFSEAVTAFLDKRQPRFNR